MRGFEGAERAAHPWLLAILAVTLSGTTLQAQQDYNDLLVNIPAGANTIVLFDANALLQSPIADKQQWKEKYEERFREGGLVIPPRTDRFVVVSQIDWTTMQPDWESWLLRLQFIPSDAELTKRSGGSLDMISGKIVLQLHEKLGAVRFQPFLYGLHWPGGRQTLGRWISETEGRKTPALPSYLAEAVRFAEAGAPIILAADLTNAVSPATIRERLEDSPAAKQGKLDIESTAKWLASIRGVSLGITVGKTRFGKIKVDFSEAVPVSPEAAKSLLLEVLGRHGLMVDEFETWKPGVAGKQFTLEGTLETAGMRRVTSLFDAPPSLQTPEPAMAAPMPMQDPKQATIAASQEYYRTIVKLLDELRGKRNTSDFYTWSQIGTWYEKYARHIDRLPIVNVDPDLLQYGSFVSSSLRDAGNSLKGIAPKTALKVQQVPDQYNTSSTYVPVGSNWAGSYGVYAWNSTYDRDRTGRLKSQASTQERISSNMNANTIMQALEESTGAIRKHLTQKYQVDF